MTSNHIESFDFQVDLDQLTELLEQEIAAAKAGELELVNELMDEKKLLVDKLLAAGPLISKKLGENEPSSSDLREGLVRLRDLMNQDKRIIERVVATLREVASQVLGDSPNKNLGGLYDAKGQKKKQKSENPRAFDLSL